VLEAGSTHSFVRRHAVDRIDPDEGRELLLSAGRANRPNHEVGFAKAKLSNLAGRDVDISITRQVAIGPQEPVTLREDVEQALAGLQVAFRDQLIGALVFAGFATAWPTATTAAATPAVSPEIIAIVRTALAGIGGVVDRRAVLGVAFSVSLSLYRQVR
jgi:hypothetical protein